MDLINGTAAATQTPSNKWFPGSTQVHNPNGISIGSAVFTARRSYASAVLGVVILSVRLSVCHTHAL